ncbi:MAG: NACHT domain-containing protein, partial [Isosphaeraceae bacterium]
MGTFTSKRRILVIGSQCASLPPPLPFLPQAAVDLHAVMTDPEVGGCTDAAPRGLLIDPTVAEARAAIKEAFRATAAEGATLLLALIGHGTHAGRDFYLLPHDGVEPPDSDTGVQLVQLVKEQRRLHPGDGLVVLIDTCSSGVAALAAARSWVSELEGDLRFELMTAAADRPAYHVCFTRQLVACLREGLDGIPAEFLRSEHVKSVIEDLCPHQKPQHLTYNADPGLYLAKNVVHARGSVGPSWAGTAAAETIQRLTAWLQPTPVLHEVVARSQEGRYVAVVGLAGSGKSALAAALARPEVTERTVPSDFVQAVAFLTGGTLTPEVASTLSDQLARSLPGFAATRDRFQQALTEDEKRQLDSLQRDVLGPLRWLGGGEAIRVVIDGLDQLATASSAAVHAALDALVTDPGLSRVRLVVTSRPDTPRPAGASEVRLDVAPDADIHSDLARRKVAESLHGAIAVRAGGNWLIASLLADQALKAPGISPESFPSDLAGLYAQNLRQAGAWATESWRGEFRPVLGALAAAGVGPILPLKLLCAASACLGGPDRPPRVRDRLVDLRGLVVRARPGTDDEHVGLFHQTLADYLLDPASDPFGIDPQEPHRALAEAIAELAPAESHDPADPLHRYAAAREAEHLWTLGEYGRVVKSLAYRQSVIPAENLKRWQSWKARIESKLGPGHPDTLTTRHNIASWTGEVGEAREALRLYRELLPDQERVLGRDHPNTLR